MAVINCPKCRKKISDKAKTCQHCDTNFDGMSAEKLQNIKKVNLIEASQKLMTHSMIAMLLFCGGFLFLYWQEAKPGTWQYVTSIGSAVLGFIIYIVTRVRLILLKRSSK